MKAQPTEFYKVPTGEIPIETIPDDKIYRFEDFNSGEVAFHNGQSSSAKLNYSLLYQELQFIDNRRDTLSLINETSIKEITIDNSYLYYDSEYGYLEIVQEFSDCALACSRRLLPVRDEGLGSSTSIDGFYDFTIPGSSALKINSMNHSVTEREFYLQPASKPITLVFHVQYYFRDFNHRWYPAKKSSLRKNFRQQHRQVFRYVAENKVNFVDEEELINLLNYGSQLK